MPYHRILLPVAGDPDEELLAHVARLADPEDAAIHVLYVVDERLFPDPSTLHDADGADAATEELRAHFEREGARATRSVEDALSAKVPENDVVTHVEQGVPPDVICRYADGNDVDAVVMATHARATSQERILGSVTHRVIQACTVPVLVIPPSITSTGNREG